MKKTLLLLSIFAGLTLGASAQCTPNPADSTHFSSGVYSYPDTVYASQNVALSGQVVSFEAPNDLSLTYTFPVVGTETLPSVHIDSMRIDSITGAPSAILNAGSPALGTWMLPGQWGCISFTGTTAVTAGNYPLTVYGTARFDTTVLGYHIDTPMSHLQLSANFPITVNVSGANGVSEVSTNLSLNIYPNPNQGNFTVTISSASEINGTMSVVDALGRTINTQSIEVSGTKQVPLEMSNLSPGAYLLVINAGGARSVKQFIVK